MLVVKDIYIAIFRLNSYVICQFMYTRINISDIKTILLNFLIETKTQKGNDRKYIEFI